MNGYRAGIAVWLLAVEILGVSLYLAHQHDIRHRSHLRERWEEAWRNRLPMLQQRLFPPQMAEEQLAALTTGALRMTCRCRPRWANT